MSARAQELAEILTTELEVTRRLLDLAKDARAAVVSADSQLLAGIVEEQEAASARIEEIEEHRVEVTVLLAVELGLPGDTPPKLAEIVRQLPGDEGLRLRSLGKELKSAAVRLRDVGERNNLLLSEAARHIDGFFQVLTKACASSIGYRQDGRNRDTKSAQMVDHQV